MWRDNDHESHCWRRAASHQSPLLDAAVVVEGDRKDGARDLLIFAHGSGLTLTRRQAQPGVDRATGHGTAIPEGVTSRALLPDLERQTVEAPAPEPADIAGSRSVNSAPPPGAAEAVTVPP
jgi:hypothetical protein